MARPRPTLADYVVVAISPVLIVALVGSLVFFLLEVFYQGQYGARMTFILAMFVVAAVLIGRISIEEGREYAAMFAIPLGIVTLIAMFRFVEFRGGLAILSPFINIGLIALIWWCADRLTWDCTLIDESKDVSGEGLLQTVGLDQDPAVRESASEEAHEALDGTTASEAPQPPKSLWQRFVASRHRAHPHGVWVVYFSLAALPLFGIGQWFIQANDLASRRYVFQLLVVYVAAALGLLLTTSFLGLRRYLRQRRLEMPTEMAGTWMGTGATMIVALLLICLLLPRRNAEYSVTHLPMFSGSPEDLWTSDWGFGTDGPEKEDAKRTVTREDAERTTRREDGQASGGDAESSQAKGGERKGKGQGESRQGKGERSQRGEESSSPSGKQDASRKDPSSGESPRDSSSGRQNGAQKGGSNKSENDRRQDGPGQSNHQDQNNGEKRAENGRESDRAAEQPNEADENARSGPREDNQPSRQQPPETSPSRSSPNRRIDPSKLFSQLGARIGGLVKLLYWVIVILVVSYLLWRYHAQIRDAVRNFLRAIREFWERLLGGGRDAVAADEAAAAGPREPPPRPFSDFPDPFLSGAADAWSTDQLVKYSFEALEAWAREHGCQRPPEQTPYEFAQAISCREATLGRDALRLAELYNLSAYAQRSAPRSNISHVRRLWEGLRERVAGAGGSP
ncbi:MAG: DUF4129 domain-containing protein [Pirellulaceae bacterium]